MKLVIHVQISPNTEAKRNKQACLQEINAVKRRATLNFSSEQ